MKSWTNLEKNFKFATWGPWGPSFFFFFWKTYAFIQARRSEGQWKG
jgi:hypothetical protein